MEIKDIQFMKDISYIISDLNGVTTILDNYSDLYVYGIPLTEEYEIKFLRYIIHQEPENIIVDSNVIKNNFAQLIIESFRNKIPLKANMDYTQGYLLDRLKNYLPEDTPLVYLWVILCGILRLKEYRSYFTSWYPNRIYIHSMNKVSILIEDISLFKSFFGKEYRNMIRIFLISIGDLIHDCPISESDNMLGTLLEKIEKDLKSCETIKDIVEFLNKTYMQLLIILSADLS